MIILTTFGRDGVLEQEATGAGTAERLLVAVRLARTGDTLLAPALTHRPVERFTATPEPV